MKNLQELLEQLQSSDVDLNFQVNRTDGKWLVTLRYGDESTLFARSDRIDQAFKHLNSKARAHLTKGE
jgi:hypothetical protein